MDVSPGWLRRPAGTAEGEGMRESTKEKACIPDALS
jgi:hypothetical protein